MALKLSFLNRAAVNGKTTATMAVAAAAYLLDKLVVPMLSGTDVDVQSVITPEFFSTILEIIFSVSILLAGVFSRDSDKTSQDNGVRDPISSKAIETKVTANIEEKLGVPPQSV